MSHLTPRRCVITLGVAEQPPADHPQVIRDFQSGITRLQASLVASGYEGDFIFWSGEYPKGAPSHRDSPCGFKPFCFFEAEAQGYEIVLWMDATVQIVRPLEELFQCIERDGYLIFAEDHSVGAYCKDAALPTLGLTREDSFAMRSCWACTLGLDLRKPQSIEFLKKWKELATDGITFPGPKWSGVRGFPPTASTDSRVKGHRYDQTAASVIALRLGMTAWRSKEVFFRFLSNSRRSIPTRSTNPLLWQQDQAVSPAPPTGKTPVAVIRVLFFSRGRGRGHAIPDLAIAEELRRSSCNLDLQFVSYATGAETIRNSGWSVVDLGLSEDNRFLPTLFDTHALIRDWKPAVVIAHEEFAALPAARMAGVPCILLTDWFPAAGQITGEAIAFADSIVFLGGPGFFPLPTRVRHAPIYVGPVVRKMTYSRIDRPRARFELAIPENAFVATVIPGAWATEEKAPIAQTVLSAFRQLPHVEKILLWLTTADHAAVSQQAADLSNVRVVKDCQTIEQVIVASDVVITKGNRGTIIDAASLGIPTLSLSHGLNPIDDALVAGVQSNKSFEAKALDPSSLCAYLSQLSAISPTQRAQPLNLHLQGGTAAAKALIGEIGRIIR